MNQGKQITSIDELPPEMISELFEYLNPKDLATCSMVNKRWHSIHAAFKLHRLAVFDYLYELRISKWYHSNQPVQWTECCHPAMFCRLTEKPLLSNLKQLILSAHLPEFDLNELNRFSRLEQLELSILFFSSTKVYLNLPRLRVLVFHLFDDFCALSIDCPQLSTLAHHGEKNCFDVKHPKTIKTLMVDWVGPELAPFNAVESLITREFEVISKATLQSLPRLRELRYNQDIESFFASQFNIGPGTVERMKRLVNEFIWEAKRLRGRDFQFTFAGFQLTSVNVDQIDFGVEVDEQSGEERVYNEYVYMKNYRLIEPDALPFLRRADYTRLLSNVTGEFPRCFSQKFTGIEWIEVDSVIEDVGQLLRFLKSLRFLRSLGLKTTGLSQEFYDQLPAATRSLNDLMLKGNVQKELNLNFDFMGEFQVSKLNIYQDLTMESVNSLARWLGQLEMCSFSVRSKGKRLLIQRREFSTMWTIKCRNETLMESKSPKEICNFFERSRHLTALHLKFYIETFISFDQLNNCHWSPNL